MLESGQESIAKKLFVAKVDISGISMEACSRAMHSDTMNNFRIAKDQTWKQQETSRTKKKKEVA